MSKNDIKFRVLHDDIYAGQPAGHPEWIYGYNLYAGDFMERSASGGNYLYYGVDKSTLGMCTGLKDKNGKDIYEGDILRCDNYPFSCEEEGEKDNYLLEVYWEPEYAAFMGTIHKRNGAKVRGISDGITLYLDKFHMLKDFEVIGNIHENGELINYKQKENE